MGGGSQPTVTHAIAHVGRRKSWATRQIHCSNKVHFLCRSPSPGIRGNVKSAGASAEQVSDEEAILSLRNDHRLSTLLIVIFNSIDPHADRIAPHRIGIIGFQQFGYNVHLVISRIEP